MSGRDDARGGGPAAPPETPPEGGPPGATAPTPEPPDVDSQADTAVADSSELTDPNADEAAERPGRGEDEGDRLVGEVLQDRYEITRKVGQGGMGAVFEARHKLIGKRVAVKVLLDKYAQKGSLVARLEQEARLASSIGHPNIIDITDFGTIDDGRTFVVMEYLEGESLGSLLAREGRLAPERAISIARQAASALGAAHEKDVIHRDVKPENVFLQRRSDGDFVKVVDFGISKMVRPAEEGDERLTQTGMVLGTPLYMSPEQARGDEELDHLIDVYALGVILYEMLTGEVPFRGHNYLNIVSQVLSEDPPAPRERVPEISEDLELIVLKAMARDRGERYQSMEELDQDLAAIQSEEGGLRTTAARLSAARMRRRHRRTRAKKLGVWGAGVAVVAGGVFAAVTALTGGRGEGAPEKTAASAGLAADAAPRPAPPDAAPPKPPWEIVTIRIETKPPGAMLYEGDRRLAKSPYDYRADKTRDEIPITARLEGYEDAHAELRPHVHDPAEPFVLELTEEDPEEAAAEPKHHRGRRHHRKKRRNVSKDEEEKEEPRKSPEDTAGGDLGGFR